MINYKYKTLPRSAPAYTGGVFSRLALLPKLALVLLVALLGSVILSVETYVGQLRAAEEAAAWDRVEAAANRVMDLQSRTYEGTLGVLLLGQLRAAMTAETQGRAIELADAYLSETVRVNRFGIADVSLVSPGGRVTSSTRPDVVGLDVAQNMAFRAHLAPDAPGIVASRPFIGRVGGLWLCTRSIALRDDMGRITQVVFLTSEALHLARALAELDDRPSHRLMVLFRSDGWVRAANHDPVEHFRGGAQPDHPVLRAAAANPAGRLVLEEPGGRYLTAYRVLPGMDRIAVASFEANTEFARLGQLVAMLRTSELVIALLTVLAAVALLRNIRMQVLLAHHATTDPLTGMLNRRALEAALQPLLARKPPFPRGIAVLLVDIDHFKRLNDTHGHLAGDAVLRIVSRELRRQTRRPDLACRWGGEEFLLVLADCDAQTALARAEGLRARIAALPPVGGVPVPTVSIGVAHDPECGETLDALVATTDEALYRAKQGGRNRVVCATPGTDGCGGEPAPGVAVAD